MTEGTFHRDRLDNGMTVLTEEVPGVRSVAVGVWIRSGARNEKPEQGGLSHFIEHMSFKGTKSRSPFDIARSLESVGGHLDAFTSKESTCYYARVLDEHLPLAVDVLSDILCHSLFDTRDIEKEKKVVVDEIRSLEDTPDDLIHDFFASAVWRNHGLGRSILGSRETVRALKRSDLLEFFRQNYGAENVIVSVAGKFDYVGLLDLLSGRFALPASARPHADPAPPEYARSIDIREKRLSQEYICVGRRGVPYGHELRFPLLVLNVAMGGGMSSRLFQRVREEEGLAYSVYTYVDFLRDSGLFCAFAAVEPGSSGRALEILLEELRKAKDSGLSQEELRSAKEQLKGSLLLGLESMSNRMTRLARSEIYYGRYISVDELVSMVEEVDADSTRAAAEMVFDHQSLSLVALGPSPKKDIESLM